MYSYFFSTNHIIILWYFKWPLPISYLPLTNHWAKLNYLQAKFRCYKIQSFRMYQKTSDEDFERAIRDLGLKVRNDPADKQELKYILLQILGYPSIQRALDHHNSNRLGTNDLLTKQEQIQKKAKQNDIDDFQICGCCGMLLQNDELPFSTHLSQLNLGIGVVLFFKDFLYYAFIFAVLFLVYSIYAISTNSIAFNSNQETRTALCSQNLGCGFSDISMGSKVINQNEEKNRMSQIQAWLGVAVVIIWGICNIVKTHLQEKQIVGIEAKRVSASDFTLMIKYFPKVHLGTSQQQCLELVQKIFNQYYEAQRSKRQCKYPYEVVSVNIARSLYMQNRRNVEHKQKITTQLHEHQNIFRTWIEYRKIHERFPFDYSGRSRVYEDYNNYYSEIFEKQVFPKVPLEQKNTIFVTLRHSKAREEIQENNAPVSLFKFWKMFKQNDFPIQDVKISKAPEPEEIKWNNIGFPASQRTFRRFIAWLATIGLIGLSLGISIGFSTIPEPSLQVSASISIVVTLANLGIQVLLVYFSSLQYEIIQSWQQSSIALKIGIAQLVNSIGVPIVVTAVSQSRGNNKSWLKANGLADDVFFIALLNLLVPISSLLDPFEHWLRLVRWWKSHPDRRLHLFGQKQLNKYYGNYRFDIGYQYVFLIKTSIFTAFFVCMQPIIALFAPFALIFYYFTVKRNLFYHFHRPRYHFETTNNTVDLILLFSLLAFGIGSLFVNNANPEVVQTNDTFPINVLIIIFACVFLIVVPFRFFYCCITKPQLENKDYKKKKMLIYSDYDRMNPITKVHAIGEFEKYLRQLEIDIGLSNEAQLVKLHVSTIQRRQTLKVENTLRQSFSRLSMVRQSMIEPQYNMDLNFYEQIAHRSSIRFGKPEGAQSPQKHDNTTGELKQLSKITEQNKMQSSENQFPK